MLNNMILHKINKLNKENIMNTSLMTRPLDLFEVVDSVFGNGSKFSKIDTLAVDVTENEKQYLVHADVPGVPKENIKVNFDKGQLSIEVEARQNNETKEGDKVLRSERFYSKKSRYFNFGDNVDESAITASYKDGVLTLEVPKREAPVTMRQIEIQ
jgi:HSP20 family protein